MNSETRMNESSRREYNFIIGGERKKYQTKFNFIDNQLEIECSCDHRDTCWHALYILAGKTSRIVGGDMHLQGELIQRIANNSKGKQLIQQANRKFAGETHCRRCHSSRIVKLNKSLYARLCTLFKETDNHKYFCKDCKWTW
ncbi:MAG: hypothetical protein JST52_04790 [Bacteroidetes bacterium]|nr:hypothetical protein [Bacteroidota bacterium]MBS1740580.1 hypothetical protein [Bacteroidota bacterium]MBS1776097.1 hypothetical protein [Bacteroidota bacterium]